MKQIPQGQTTPNPFKSLRSAGATRDTEREWRSSKLSQTCQTWASKNDLSDYGDLEISTAYNCVLRSSQALQPYYSVPRTAYRKLLAEMQRRGLA